MVSGHSPSHSANFVEHLLWARPGNSDSKQVPVSTPRSWQASGQCALCTSSLWNLPDAGTPLQKVYLREITRR